MKEFDPRMVPEASRGTPAAGLLRQAPTATEASRTDHLRLLEQEINVDPIKQLASLLILLKYQDMMTIARELQAKLTATAATATASMTAADLADMLHTWASDKFPKPEVEDRH